jgi:hypothetical protein
MTTETEDRAAERPLTYREVVEILRLVEASTSNGSLRLRTGDITLEVTRAPGRPAKDA